MPLSESVTLFLPIFKTSLLPNRKSYADELLREWSPPTTFHMSRVTCHMSFITCHVSHVMCHMSSFFFLFFFRSGSTYWWRVCYQRGLPFLIYLSMSKKLSIHLIFIMQRFNFEVCLTAGLASIALAGQCTIILLSLVHRNTANGHIYTKIAGPCKPRGWTLGCKYRPATTTPPVSRSGYPPWNLKSGGVESSGRRLISSFGKTKRKAFFSLFGFGIFL